MNDGNLEDTFSFNSLMPKGLLKINFFFTEIHAPTVHGFGQHNGLLNVNNKHQIYVVVVLFKIEFQEKLI